MTDLPTPPAKNLAKWEISAARIELSKALAENATRCTDGFLHDSGRYFDDTCEDLTQCTHSETGNYQNDADGKIIAALWNAWRAGLLILAPEQGPHLDSAPYPAGDRRYPPEHPLSPEKCLAAYRSGAALPKGA